MNLDRRKLIENRVVVAMKIFERLRLKMKKHVKIRTVYRLVGLLFFLGSNVTGLSAPSAENARTKESFCETWRFHLGDKEGAEKPGFDDAKWRALDVPHDWSIELPYDPNMSGGSAVAYLPGGIGWYRKSFTLPKSDIGKVIAIDFDGVYMDSQVWINGHLLGRLPNGYLGFRYNLTPYLKFGEEKNHISVRVNVETNGTRWYPGSGIYRNVWLTTMNPIHVAHWGSYVTTPEVSKEKATVRLRTEVKNTSEASADVILNSVILDPQGNAVAKAESKQSMTAGTMHDFDQSFVVSQPLRWSPDTPDMYQVVSTVTTGGKTVDTYNTPLGIRTVEFTVDQGFFLNGEPVDIKGVCLHHDFGALGTAISNRALERQLEILRAMGCNAIRTSHNPREPEFYAMCDRMGFMVMNEAFDVWQQKKMPNDYHKYFKDWHEHDLTSMLRRDRNHPSVIMWSIGNEMNEQHKEDFPGQGGVIAKRLVEICRQHDPSRVVTAALNSPEASERVGITAALDVYGQNYNLIAYPKLKGKKPMIGTENATSFITRGSYAFELVNDQGLRLKIQNFKNNSECTGYGKFWGDDRTEGTLIEMRNSPWVAGQFAWTGFDYLGECFPFRWPARNGLFGIVDLAGFPKDSYYIYQADWTDEPSVHIVPQNWNWRQFIAPIPVWVYSNSEEVELFINNRSLGVKRINRAESLHAEWLVGFEPGELKAVGRTDGRVVSTDIVRTAGKPMRLEVTADRTEIAADGTDLSYLKIRLVDEHGIVSPDSDRMLKVSVEGAGTLVGVDNGHHMNHSPFKGNQVETSYGLALAIVKSAKDAGAIRVNVSADGIQPGQVAVEALPVGDARLVEAAANRDKLFRDSNKKFSRHHLAKIPKVLQVENLVSGKTATASSSSPQHPPIHAIDGDSQTRWCPKDGSTGHSWQVDLGGPRDLKSAKIIWQTAGKYQYIVEGSADGANWVMLSDQSKKQDAQQEHNLAFDRKGIRHVRITTTGLPNGLWGTFSEVEIHGVMVDGPGTTPTASASMTGTGVMIVAPVFKHGSGQHTDSVVASRNKKPPTWSEKEARNVVMDEAKKLGLEFSTDGEMPMGMDGVSKTGKIVFEILTSEDVPDRTDNTDRITDFLAAAQKLAEELKTKSGDYVAGVFYDPLAAKGTVADEEPLRAQVRDFIAWLKKEKNLK
jgi:beta-galactosidase